MLALENFGLPLVSPAGMARERVDILRAAFLAMCGDKDYQAEALKFDQPIGAPLDGAALAAMMNELAATATPGIVAAYSGLPGRSRRHDHRARRMPRHAPSGRGVEA